MALLPKELFNLICSFTPLSGIRLLAQTCKLFNRFAIGQIPKKSFYKLPDQFQKFMHIHSMEKFTIELAFDQYVIPEKYYIQSNKVLTQILAYFGDLDRLKVAKSIGCRICFDTLSVSVTSGNIDVLKYCIKNNVFTIQSHSCVVCETVSFSATERGHINILKYLHKKEYVMKWHKISDLAAKFNHLDILKWSHEFTFGEQNWFRIAVDHASIDVLQWIVDNDLHIDWPYLEKESGRSTDLRLVKWALKNSDVRIDKIAISAIDSDNAGVMKILLDHGLCTDGLDFIGRLKITELFIQRKIFIKPIAFNNFDATYAKLLLEHNLLIIGTEPETCIKLIKLGFVDKINFKPIQRPRYHFNLVDGGWIKKIKYGLGTSDCQKLICLDSDGSVQLADLGTDCNCFWYLFAAQLTEYPSDSKLLLLEKLTNCLIHSKYY